MKKKYKMHQEVYFKDCTRDFQLSNPLKINFISETRTLIKDNIEGDHEMVYNVYSTNGFSWYPENTLTDIVKG